MAGSRARAGCKPRVAQEPPLPAARPQRHRGVPQPRLLPARAGLGTGVQEHEAWQPPKISVSWQRAQPGVPKPHSSSSRGYLRDVAVM